MVARLRWVRVAVLAVILGLHPLAGWAACRQALLLALDVSGSVDQREYRLQLDGLAGALLNPQVVAALNAMPGAPVRLAVMEWSGPNFQRVIVPWRDIDGPIALQQVVDRLRMARRVQGDFSTAIGSALLRAASEMGGQKDCWRRVIDVSGDGISNTGPQPQSVLSELSGITVNGLVIGGGVSDGGGQSAEIGALVAYYRAYVLRGEDAFLETAHGFADFQAAMVRKLLRELQVVAVSNATKKQTR